ncbi:VC0807 family protein [Virgibacillus ainsalahensis]
MAKKQGTGKKLIILDLIFYAALPYIIWKYGREPFGDYAAMLISTIPGFAYTIYRFYLEKQFNIVGLFIIGTLVLGTTVDLLSGSAEQMLWNGVYLGLFYVVIHFVALIIKRPFALYFAVDFVYLQGHARKDSKTLFFQKEIFKWFQFIQALFIVRGLFMAGLKVFLLQKYGVDGYDEMLIYRQIAGWFFGILITGMFIYTNVPIQRFLDRQRAKLQDSKNSTSSNEAF